MKPNLDLHEFPLDLTIEKGKFRLTKFPASPLLDTLNIIEKLAGQLVHNLPNDDAYIILCESLEDIAFNLKKNKCSFAINEVYRRIKNLVFPLESLQPAEIISEIFSYLSYQELIIASRVNHRWRILGEKEQVRLGNALKLEVNDKPQLKFLLKNLTDGIYSLSQHKDFPSRCIVYDISSAVNKEATLVRFENVMRKQKEIRDQFFYESCVSGNISEALTLLYCAADPNKELNRRLPLQIVGERGHIELMKLLICLGADVNLKSEDGISVLFYLISTWQKPEAQLIRIVELLLDHKVIPDECYDEDSTISLALKKGFREVFNMLIKKIDYKSDFSS